MKKSVNDSSLVASRLMLVMDDLLWVLTDLQLKAAILFANSVSKYVEKASKYSKMKAGKIFRTVKKRGNVQPSKSVLKYKRHAGL